MYIHSLVYICCYKLAHDLGHFYLVQGAGNKGFDVLLQNYKVGLGTGKELNEFIKER